MIMKRRNCDLIRHVVNMPEMVGILKVIRELFNRDFFDVAKERA